MTDEPEDWMAAFDALPVDPVEPSDWRPETQEQQRARRRREAEAWNQAIEDKADAATGDLFAALGLPEWDQGPGEPQLMAIRWTDTYTTDPPPAEDPVIEGLLNAGEFMVVGAERGIGKTWLNYNIASVLTTGGALFGRLPVPRPRKVLVLQGELDETQAAIRWQMLHPAGPFDTDGSELPHIAESFDPVRFRVVRRRHTYRGPDDSFSDEYLDASIDERLEATIVALGIEVVVVDPWAVFFSGNESSNDEVEAVLSKLREIGMRNRVAWIISHHFGKGREVAEKEDLWRGASRLADWAANRVTITRHYSDKKATERGLSRREARRYADLHFLRRGAPLDDFSVHLGLDGWWHEWADEDDQVVTGTHDTELLDALNVHGVFTSNTDAAGKCTAARLAKDKKAKAMSVNTAKDHLWALHRQGIVSHELGARGADIWSFHQPLPTDGGAS